MKEEIKIGIITLILFPLIGFAINELPNNWILNSLLILMFPLIGSFLLLWEGGKRRGKKTREVLNYIFLTNLIAFFLFYSIVYLFSFLGKTALVLSAGLVGLFYVEVFWIELKHFPS